MKAVRRKKFNRNGFQMLTKQAQSRSRAFECEYFSFFVLIFISFMFPLVDFYVLFFLVFFYLTILFLFIYKFVIKKMYE